MLLVLVEVSTLLSAVSSMMSCQMVISFLLVGISSPDISIPMAVDVRSCLTVGSAGTAGSSGNVYHGLPL